MANRSDLDWIIAKAKREMMYDTFLASMRIIAEGETFIKKASKAGLGGSACVFLPKRYIGQQIRVIITPIKGEVVAANQAVIDSSNKALAANRKLRKAEARVKELESGNTQVTEDAIGEPDKLEDLDISKEEKALEDDDAY